MQREISDIYLNGDCGGYDISFYKDIPEDIKERIKKENITVSIIASAIRPEFWISFYENVTQNNSTPIEVVFCGDAQYDFELPKNFRYIYTEVKPSQCYEIAIRNAKGTFIIVSSDDILYNKYHIDNLVYTYLVKSKSEYDIVSSVFPNHALIHNSFYGGREMRKNKILDTSHDIPYVSLGVFMKRETFNKIGGSDRRFVGPGLDLDITMRLMEKGGKLYISPYSVLSAKVPNKLSKDRFAGMKRDHKPLLKSFWFKKYRGEKIDPNLYYTKVVSGMIVSRKRLLPVESFLDENILIESQGPKGRWK